MQADTAMQFRIAYSIPKYSDTNPVSNSLNSGSTSNPWSVIFFGYDSTSLFEQVLAVGALGSALSLNSMVGCKAKPNGGSPSLPVQNLRIAASVSLISPDFREPPKRKSI